MGTAGARPALALRAAAAAGGGQASPTRPWRLEAARPSVHAVVGAGGGQPNPSARRGGGGRRQTGQPLCWRGRGNGRRPSQPRAHVEAGGCQASPRASTRLSESYTGGGGLRESRG
jgi:hypothetical protein